MTVGNVNILVHCVLPLFDINSFVIIIEWLMSIAHSCSEHIVAYLDVKYVVPRYTNKQVEYFDITVSAEQSRRYSQDVEVEYVS